MRLLVVERDRQDQSELKIRCCCRRCLHLLLPRRPIRRFVCQTTWACRRETVAVAVVGHPPRQEGLSLPEDHQGRRQVVVEVRLWAWIQTSWRPILSLELSPEQAPHSQVV